MSPLTVFIRTLAKSTAIFLGAGLDLPQPVAVDWPARAPVTAQKSPTEEAADALIGALKDSDVGGPETGGARARGRRAAPARCRR